jgi:hypothetical protein
LKAKTKPFGSGGIRPHASEETGAKTGALDGNDMHLDKVVEDDPLFLEVRSFDLE